MAEVKIALTIIKNRANPKHPGSLNDAITSTKLGLGLYEGPVMLLTPTDLNKLMFYI